jgi:glutathione S-transferase
MAKMRLYYSPSSPYARKVRVLALETKLDKKIDMINVALTPIQPNADVDKHNPIGKIPALSVKGMDLFDSPVICEYLDHQHKGRKLVPRKGRDRWVALRQQAMGDGLLDAALLARYEGFLRPEDRRWPDWTKGQMKKIDGHDHDRLRLGLSRFPLRQPRLARQAAQARKMVHDLLQAAVDEGDRAAGQLRPLA